jgi:hypothetical protein
MGGRTHPLTRSTPLSRWRARLGRPQTRDPITALRTRAARLLWAEFFAQALAPAIFLLLAYIAAALFGFANSWAFAAICALAAIAVGISLARLPRPTAQKIDHRIEAASGLKHRPLATIEDEPEDDNPIALALWAAHRQRTLAILATARIGAPAPAAALRDPWSLRSLLLLLLLGGLIIAGPAIPARLTGAFTLPTWPFAGPTVTAWLTPPAYTGQPPQILTLGTPITALVGSKLAIITDGPTTAPSIRLAGTLIPSNNLNDTSYRADATIQTSGALRIGPWWHRLASWQITAIPPGAPVLTLGALDITQTNHLKLHWNITDAYGLQTVTATIAPSGFTRALTQTFTLPTNTGDGAASLDLSTSPFHDLPLDITLTATNTAAQTAATIWPSHPKLPGLTLHDATALDLDQLRQTLATDTATIRIVATDMQTLSQNPPSPITPAADIKLAVLTCAIWLTQTGPQDAVDQMLALIQEMEAGPNYDSDKALAAANQALTAALQRGLNGQMPDAATLQKLLQAMQDALAQHLAALQPSGSPPPAGAQQLDMSALNQMAQKIAADEAAGRTEQAAQELQQLENILNALASAKPMTPAQMKAAAAAAAAAQKIAQMTQGEAALLNKTHQGQAQPGDQATLQSELNATEQNLSNAGVNTPGLHGAGTAMSNAQRALASQNGQGAEAQENAAIKSLQQAAASLAAAERNSFSFGASPPGMPSQNQDGPEGGPDEQSTPLPINNAANPARIIEQQIINQDAIPTTAPATHQYYHRLLQDGVGQ